MTWLSQLDDIKGLQIIYGAIPEALVVEVDEIVLNTRGPSVILRLELAEFPQSPPPKWKDFNTVSFFVKQ